MKKGASAPVIKSPKSDPQRGRLYKLEREIDGNALGHKASERYLRKMTRRVCEYYEIRVPRLFFVRQTKNLTYGWAENTVGRDDHQIYLNAGFNGQNAVTLLHELAHYVVDARFVDHEPHGKEFVAVYMHLLHREKIIPQDAFRVIARRWGVRIAREYLPLALYART